MQTAVIIDVIAAAALLGFVIAGCIRGLFHSLAGLVIVVIALVGAGLIADTLTAPVSKVVQPVIEKRIEARVDKALSGSTQSAASSETASETVSPQAPTIGETEQTEPSSAASRSAASSGEEEPTDLLSRLQANQLLRKLGIDSSLSETLSKKAQETVRETGVSVASAVVETMAESVIHVLLFVLAFLLLIVLLKLLMHLVDLVLKLPGLNFLNCLGGAAFGLVEGALVLFLAVWILRRFGVSFETETVESTYLLRFFTENSPLDLLSFL